MRLKLLRFISEPITVHFVNPPSLEKTPTCPQGFSWGDKTFVVKEVLAEWQDFQRRGRMKRNMSPAHGLTAARRGSWGVGQFNFQVLTREGRVFQIYYDRAPKNAGDRKGSWYLDRELEASD